MKRFKLANGGTIASCKQPLQNKDFDRIEINDIAANQARYTYFSISIINPSSHLIRKTFNRELRLVVTPVPRNFSITGHPYKGMFTNFIIIEPLHTGYNEIELDSDDMYYWIRDNLNPRSQFDEYWGNQRSSEGAWLRIDGRPWLPGSRTGHYTGFRNHLDKLIFRQADNYDYENNSLRGACYNGQVYGNLLDPETERYIPMKDQVTIRIMKGKSLKQGGIKHIRRMIKIEEIDVYTTYENL